MLVTFLRIIFICVVVIFFANPVFAQRAGGGTGGGSSSGGGYTGGGNSGGSSGGGYTGGSSSSSGSSSGSTGELVSDFDFGESVADIGFQGLETERSEFIGVDPSAKFIGIDDAFDDSRASSSSTRTTSNARSTSRTNSTRRSTGMNRSTSQNTTRITNAGREIAATAIFEPAENSESTTNKLRTNPAKRQTELKTKILRLTNLKLNAENFNITLENTPSGIVAELTGNAPSERTSKIIKQLLLLEPGIDDVKNNLKIK
ncbi:MAG: hypothetical protein LBP59_08055 [Planctomycetaceae bacterium]|nr:hypothetical protein [Planctomycetaceae bacterium]